MWGGHFHFVMGHFGIRWVDIYHGKPTVAPHNTNRQRPDSQVKDIADMAILSARMEASKSSKRRKKATNHPLGCLLPKLISTRNQKQKWWDMIASGFATCDGKLILTSITWSIFSSIFFHGINISWLDLIPPAGFAKSHEYHGLQLCERSIEAIDAGHRFGGSPF